MNHYYQLLGIPANLTRPTLFQLLCIPESESDPRVIKAAANDQLKKLRAHQDGPHAEECKRLAAEVKRAYHVLAKEETRGQYIAKLDQARRQAAVRADAQSEQDFEPKSVPGAAPGRSLNGTLLLIGSVAAVLVIVGVGWSLYMVLGGTKATDTADRVADVGPSEPPLTESTQAADGIISAQADIPDPSDPATTAPEPQPALNSDSPPNDPMQAFAQPPWIDSPGEGNATSTATPDQEQNSGADREAGAPPAAAPVASNLPLETTSTDAVADLDQETVTEQAHSVLKRTCYRCHGENGTDEGGFHFVLSRNKLISSGFVVPNNPKDSFLLERIVSTDSPMPPEGESPRPSKAEITGIESWIRQGAKPFDDAPTTPFITPDQFHKLIAQDLNRVPKKDRVYARYFSVTHLSNAGFADEEIQIYRAALGKLLNSLSWNRKLATPRPSIRCRRFVESIFGT